MMQTNFNSKKIFLWVICFCCITAFSNKVYAGNGFYGGEMYYKHLHGSVYKFYMVIYSNCTGTTPDPPKIEITDGTTTKLYTDTMCCSSNYTMGFNSGQCTLCSGSCSFGFGIQFITYYATIDIGGFSGCNITASFSYCCSYYKITTGGGDEEVYVNCKLNRCNGDHDAPVFQESGQFLMNVAKPVDIYQTATPYNINDSVVYRLVPPLKDSVHTIAYTPGYEYTFPMTYGGISPNDSVPGGFHYFQNTGELFFVPQQTDESLMSIEADEYAKTSSGSWYLAGTTTKTLTLLCSKLKSSNDLPQVAPLKEAPNDTIYTCAGISLEIQFKTTDPDNHNDTMSLMNIVNETGGQFNFNGDQAQSALFSWVPTNEYVRKQPYKIIMMAEDALYPMGDFSQKAFYIVVKDSMPLFSIKQDFKGCGHYAFAISGNVPAGIKYKWEEDSNVFSNADTASYNFFFNGKHVIILQLTNAIGCSWFAYDTINVNILPILKMTGGQKICPGTGATLTVKGAINYTWSPTASLKPDTGSTVTAYPSSTMYFYVMGSDKNGCLSIDSALIMVDITDAKINADTTECLGQMASVICHSKNAKSYKWVNDAGALMSDSDVLYFKLVSDTQYSVTVTDSFGCSKTISGIVKADAVKPTVVEKSVSVCFGDSVRLQVSGGIKYNWNATPGLLNGSLKSDPFVKPAHQTIFMVTVTDSYNCSANDSVLVLVSNISQRPMQNATICPGDSVQLLASGGRSYSWYPAVNISNAHIANPFVHPDSTTIYIATVCDTLCGCVRKDSATVKVNPFIKISLGKDEQICAGQSVYMGTNAEPGYIYSWSSSPAGYQNTNADDIVSPSATTTYYLNYKNTYGGCNAVDSLKISVNIINAQFTGNQNACQRDTSSYYIISYNPSNSYTWKIEGGHVGLASKNKITIGWDSVGNDKITLIETSPGKCSDSLSESIICSQSPVAHIIASKLLCLGDQEAFIDSGTTANSYSWKFGNGDTSNLKDPVYLYKNQGVFYTRLISTLGKCTNADSAAIQVFDKPVRHPVISHIGVRQYRLDNSDSIGIVYNWKTGDGDSMNYSDLVHTYTDTGLYKIIFSYSYPWGCPNIFDTTIHVTDMLVNSKDTAYVLPNPFKDQLNLVFSQSREQSVEITIYDAIGQVVTRNIMNEEPAGNYTLTLPAWQIRRGIYFLKYQAGYKVIVFKIIKM